MDMMHIRCEMELAPRRPLMLSHQNNGQYSDEISHITDEVAFETSCKIEA
jgi:hypothetical protein